MVTLSKIENGNRIIAYLAGLSSDTKPQPPFENTWFDNGSWFKEIDTGKRYQYDKESKSWIIQVGSNSGGSSDGNVSNDYIATDDEIENIFS